MVDFKCEKCGQFFFHLISITIFLGTVQTILRKKVFASNKKKSSDFLLIAVEHEPVPTRVLNPKSCGVQRRSPGGGCGGAKPPRKKTP